MRLKRQRARERDQDAADAKRQAAAQEGKRVGDAGYRYHARVPKTAAPDYVQPPPVSENVRAAPAAPRQRGGVGLRDHPCLPCLWNLHNEQQAGIAFQDKSELRHGARTLAEQFVCRSQRFLMVSCAPTRLLLHGATPQLAICRMHTKCSKAPRFRKSHVPTSWLQARRLAAEGKAKKDPGYIARLNKATQALQRAKRNDGGTTKVELSTKRVGNDMV